MRGQYHQKQVDLASLDGLVVNALAIRGKRAPQVKSLNSVGAD